MKLIIIFYLLSVFLANLPFVSAQEIPTITATQNNNGYTLQDIFYIDGTAEPNAAIELNFTGPDAKSIAYQIKTNSEGKWVFAQKLELADGEWKVRARITRQDNSVSEWSDPLFFSSVTTTRPTDALFWIFIFILFLTIIAVATRIFFWHKNKIKKDKILKEVKEAELKTKENFSALERDTTAAFDAIGAFSLAENETAAEKEKIKNKISALETETEKEINDIEKII